MTSMVRAVIPVLFVRALHGQAHADPQIRIYPNTATTGSMYPLKPGLYGGGDIHGALQRGAEFLRISSVSELAFRGTLEIARVEPIQLASMPRSDEESALKAKLITATVVQTPIGRLIV